MTHAMKPMLTGLLILLATGPAADAGPRFFGHYLGHATVTTSPFYPPGVYDAEAAVAQTESGVVGYVNITYDASDFLSGIITHSFSAPIEGPGPLLTLKYSDRLCGGGDPIDKCYPQAPTNTQYSFRGPALFLGTKLTLSQPELLPGLPYETVLPFDSVELSRVPGQPRTSFEGVYGNLSYIWMGTIFLPLPLPLYGDNMLRIIDGEIVQWWGSDGAPVPIPGVISESCFDDGRRLGWMNQQGEWGYRWVLDPEGRGLGVIVTFTYPPPPVCEDLQDPLPGGDLDLVHKNLVGFMHEPASPVVGPGAARNLRVGHDDLLGTLELSWSADCGTGTAYAVYRGDLASGYASIAPEPGHCADAETQASIPEGDGTAEFLVVVPTDGVVEGSYGIDWQGNSRPRAGAPCYAESIIDSCAP